MLSRTETARFAFIHPSPPFIGGWGYRDMDNPPDKATFHTHVQHGVEQAANRRRTGKTRMQHQTQRSGTEAAQFAYLQSRERAVNFGGFLWGFIHPSPPPPIKGEGEGYRDMDNAADVQI